MNLSSNLIGNSNNETNFPHKLLLTNTQVSKIRKAFGNGSSANIKFYAVRSNSCWITCKQLIKRPPEITRGLIRYFVNKKLNKISKKSASSKSSGITLTNNEIKDIKKVIKSSESRGIY